VRRSLNGHWGSCQDDLDVHFWKHSYGHEEVDEIVLQSPGYRHSRRKTISTRK
jgi:hypothetical protein